MRILTDSTSDYTRQEAEQFNIDIVPLKVIIDGKEYKDRVDIQPEEFYEKLVCSEELPTTSQPSPQDFLDYITKAKKANEPILMILLSSVLSGTYQSAMIAKELSGYDDVYIIDSQTTILGLRLLVDKAIELKNEGKDVKEIVSIIEMMKEKVRIFAIVDTLEYFYKGGRLSKTTTIAGTLLKLKPIVGLKTGNLGVFAKARGSVKGINEVIRLIHENNDIDLHEKIYVGYTGGHQGIDKFINMIDEKFSIGNVPCIIVGPVIGTHVGPNAKAIAYFCQ